MREKGDDIVCILGGRGLKMEGGREIIALNSPDALISARPVASMNTYLDNEAAIIDWGFRVQVGF